MNHPTKFGQGFEYRFSVEAQGHPWDVYSFRKDGQPGTLAFAQIRGEWVIGVFCAGTLSMQEVFEKLKDGQRP